MTTNAQTRLSEIRQRSYSAKRHGDDLSPAWVSYASDTAFLLAELDAARAREAKLREALVRIKADHDGRLDMEDCGCGICEDVRAALAAGEDTHD